MQVLLVTYSSVRAMGVHFILGRQATRKAVPEPETAMSQQPSHLLCSTHRQDSCRCGVRRRSSRWATCGAEGFTPEEHPGARTGLAAERH